MPFRRGTGRFVTLQSCRNNVEELRLLQHVVSIRPYLILIPTYVYSDDIYFYYVDSEHVGSDICGL